MRTNTARHTQYETFKFGIVICRNLAPAGSVPEFCKAWFMVTDDFGDLVKTDRDSLDFIINN